MADHVHVSRPGESTCFVCGADTYDAARRDAGLPSRGPDHEQVTRWYGELAVEECRRCGVEWPCPAIKAIKRNAKQARERRRAEREH